ncbi:MAG TPA: hypothetical protein VEF04_14180 [Blastocatellia bacterium]|nr:hypothetical protein [Blastocatellia bacterium]
MEYMELKKNEDMLLPETNLIKQAAKLPKTLLEPIDSMTDNG